MLAGLRTIPAELHESARVDGAGGWRIFWRVSYPLLKPEMGLPLWRPPEGTTYR